MRQGRIRAAAIAAVVLLGAAPALAQNQKPAPGQAEAEARKHYERGEAYQRLEQWDQAKIEYLRAWELSKKPLLIFNVGQVCRLKGDVAGAVEYYKRYLELQSEGVEADFARDYIEEHEAELEKKEAEAAAEAARLRNESEVVEETDETVEPAATEDSAADENRSPFDGRDATPPASTDAPARPGRGLRIGGLASGGSGVVLLATGIGFGIRAKNIAGELEDLDMWSPEQDTRYREGEDAERNSIILYSLGAAAVVTGGVLYFLGHRAGAATGESLTVTPAFDRDFGGVVAAGRF